MPYTTPSFENIRARILRDVLNLDADAHVDVDSDHFIRASATASAVEGIYDHQRWMTRQIVPDTADTEYLEMHAGLRGIVRKPATAATGTVLLTGRAGAAVPVGTAFRDEAGVLYATTDAAELEALADNPDEGSAAVPCAAGQVGALPDLDHAPVTLLAAPTGVRGKGSLDLTGGTDPESDASLLQRLLFFMRNPPGGGNAADYRRWAMEVPGVVEARVYPLRQGAGTVDIVVMGENGVPDAAVVAACQKYLDEMRPVTARSTVYAPLPLPVNMRLRIRVRDDATLLSLQSAVEETLAARFQLLRPGDTLVLSRLLAAVVGLSGVEDAAIVEPAANVPAEAMQWLRLGAVTLEGM